jgi:hypothetical protein
MEPITITEALAEIKTIGKRLEKKREFYANNLARQDGVKDPLEKDGGAIEVLKREAQAIIDLEVRLLGLRLAISAANDATMVNVNGQSMSISAWLTWRRDIAPKQKEFLTKLQGAMKAVRDRARTQGINVMPLGGTAGTLTDIVVNISETDLASDIERMETTLGALDGKLSLMNATTVIGAV